MSPTAAIRIGRTWSTPSARRAVDDLNETAYLPVAGASMLNLNRPNRPARARPGESPDASVSATTAAAPDASTRTPAAGTARLRMATIVTTATDGEPKRLRRLLLPDRLRNGAEPAPSRKNGQSDRNARASVTTTDERS